MTDAVVLAERTSATTSMALETRLTSLDVFRGLTIFAMIIVNDSGDFTHTYPPLLHAQWDHITPTDLIFPFFLFIVGVGLAVALRPYLSSTPPEEIAPARRWGLI